MKPPARARAATSRRPLTVTLAALALAGLLTACSDDDHSDANDTTSSTTTTTSSPATTASVPELSAEQQSEFETEFEFASCMRDQGIAGFPDPQLSADGYKLVGVPWQRDSDQWNVAAETCQSDLAAAASGDPGAASEWEKVVPGGDCQCADGSEFAFFERQADPTKVVFFLDGGGNCYDATTCAFVPEGYDWKVNDNPAEEGGIFDFARADNPFRDYSFIYVPRCTGDLHLGDITRQYSPELTVEHNGYVNGTTVLDYVAEHYPDATQVVVVGKSDGAAAAIYGGLAADRLHDAKVTVFDANSGALPDDPDLNAEIGELWGAYDTMPDWEVNQLLTARDWGPRRFWIQAGLHNPELVLARFDFAYDREVAQDAESLGLDPSETLASIDANEAAIESAGVVQHSYTAPGDGHTILEDHTFYETEVNGITLVDWVDALITGQPLEDVHCDHCETP